MASENSAPTRSGWPSSIRRAEVEFPDLEGVSFKGKRVAVLGSFNGVAAGAVDDAIGRLGASVAGG